MQPNGQADINETLKAWADIVIEKFRAKITELKVYDQGYLDESLMYELLVNAGNDIEKIELSFKLYGIFVDMGVGKEISKGNRGDLDFTPTRKPKPWYSLKFYGQVMKLRELLLENYSRAITFSLINTLQTDFDQRFRSVVGRESHTVSSLRTVRYREVTSRRTARNYASRREQPGHWSGGKTWKVTE
jgi:hypothetical protein